jgi:hypothetical protein
MIYSTGPRGSSRAIPATDLQLTLRAVGLGIVKPRNGFFNGQQNQHLTCSELIEMGFLVIENVKLCSPNVTEHFHKLFNL